MKHITLAAVCAALLASPALADWTEDFQAYAVGSNIVGQGGWEGWDGDAFPDALVADDPAGVPGNKVLKEAANNDIVHQYSGYTSGAWVYSAKQYIPGTQQGKGPTSLILMNNYNIGGAKGWGLDLNFDLNNSVVNDGEGGEGGVPIVYDQWIDIRIEIDLDTNLRTTYYNHTLVGSAIWYDTGDANHAKSIAAVDLWADVGGDPIYYDDLSLQPGTPVATGTNLTTHGSTLARYLVNLGQGFGDTITTGSAGPTGIYEIANAGGNQNAWWHINNGNPAARSTMVTFLGSSPDYFGYKLKMPATVNKIVWWNDARFGDGGTFAAMPEVQYLDGMNGTWQTIADVTWNRPYNKAYAGGIRAYVATLNSPPPGVWGIRLIGDTESGVDDDGSRSGSSGFVGVTEMILYGSVDLGLLDLSNNLGLASKGGSVIANHWHFGTKPDLPEVARINDGLFVDSNDTWGSGDPLDYVGITWPTAQDNVAAVGIVIAGFADGGYFGAWGAPDCPDNVDTSLRVEYTIDGNTWTPTTGLNLGRYPLDAGRLQQLRWGADTGFLFRFDPVSGIKGIRLIGPPSGYVTVDNNGFVGVIEFEVFANSGGLVQAPPSAPLSLPSFKGLMTKTIHRLRATIQY